MHRVPRGRTRPWQASSSISSTRRARGRFGARYQIPPASTASILPETDPAIVTVEWGESAGEDLLAFWSKLNQDGCTDTEYIVQTYTFGGDAIPDLSNNIAFLITVS